MFSDEIWPEVYEELWKDPVDESYSPDMGFGREPCGCQIESVDKLAYQLIIYSILSQINLPLNQLSQFTGNLINLDALREIPNFPTMQ